jgi:hypothetical protein
MFARGDQFMFARGDQFSTNRYRFDPGETTIFNWMSRVFFTMFARGDQCVTSFFYDVCSRCLLEVINFRQTGTDLTLEKQQFSIGCHEFFLLCLLEVINFRQTGTDLTLEKQQFSIGQRRNVF